MASQVQGQRKPCMEKHQATHARIGAWEGGATNAKLKQISQELDPQGNVYTAAMLTAQGGTCLAHWPCQKLLHSHTGPTKGSRNGMKRNSTDNVQSFCTDRTTFKQPA